MHSVSLKSTSLLKSTVFPVIYLIIQNQITNTYLTKITLVVEFLQMYSYPLHPKVNFITHCVAILLLELSYIALSLLCDSNFFYLCVYNLIF